MTSVCPGGECVFNVKQTYTQSEVQQEEDVEGHVDL